LRRSGGRWPITLKSTCARPPQLAASLLHFPQLRPRQPLPPARLELGLCRLQAWLRGYLCEGSPACSGSATTKTTVDARDRLELHRCGQYSTRRRTRCSPRGPGRSQS
jgi:hypothetical protein